MNLLTKSLEHGINSREDLVELILNLDKLANVCLIFHLEFLAVIFVGLHNLCLSLIQCFVQLREKVSQVNDFLFSEGLNFCDLLL
jgi:hypothetical protein